MPLARAHELEFTTTAGDDWLSVHADTLRFAGEVDAVARALSKELSVMTVSLALFDDSDLACACFVGGRAVATATMKQGHRLQLAAKKWAVLGASPKVLATLSRRGMDDPTEAAFIIARAFGIPEDTVLADEGDAATPARRKKPQRPRASALSDSVASEWAELERQAGAHGVAVPKLTSFLKMQAAFGQPFDEPAVRSTIALLRKTMRAAAKRRA